NRRGARAAHPRKQSPAATSASRSRIPTDRARHSPSSGLLAGGTVLPPEISGCSILAGLDDAAAHRARFAKELVQCVAVSKTNGALHGGQVFAEAPKHLQHRLLVVEEDVAPHDGVGGGDAREIAKPASRKLDHLGVGHLLKVPRGVDDVIGNQVWHMTG